MKGVDALLCERCKENKATVHYTEVINGQKKQLHLCEGCAREFQPQGLSFMPQLNLHDFLGGLMGHSTGKSGLGAASSQARRCDVCNLSEKQFAQQGLLGCGNCYDSFKGTLDSLIRRIHGTNRHTGKLPEKTSGRVKLYREIESMRRQLKQAVEAEEFENAAKLRDSIRDLEKGLEKEG